MINVTLHAIIRAINDQGSQLIYLNDQKQIPHITLTASNTYQPIDQITDCLSGIVKMPTTWLDVRYLGCYLDNYNLCMYYDTYIPYAHAHSDIINNFQADFAHLPHHTVQAIMEK